MMIEGGAQFLRRFSEVAHFTVIEGEAGQLDFLVAGCRNLGQ